jgi:hypothetical protein
MFLAKAKINKYEYMREDEFDTIDDMRIVMANTIDEASDKYHKFWADQDDQYGSNYTINQLDITATIL